MLLPILRHTIDNGEPWGLVTGFTKDDGLNSVRHQRSKGTERHPTNKPKKKREPKRSRNANELQSIIHDERKNSEDSTKNSRRREVLSRKAALRNQRSDTCKRWPETGAKEEHTAIVLYPLLPIDIISW